MSKTNNVEGPPTEESVIPAVPRTSKNVRSQPPREGISANANKKKSRDKENQKKSAEEAVNSENDSSDSNSDDQPKNNIKG